MRQEALENLFAQYVSEGKWAEEDVPRGLRNNVGKKVRELQEERRNEASNTNNTNNGRGNSNRSSNNS